MALGAPMLMDVNSKSSFFLFKDTFKIIRHTRMKNIIS